MNEATNTPGIWSYLVSFWLALVTAVWLANPSDPLARRVFAGHMLVLAGYGLGLTAVRLWHNRNVQCTAKSAFIQGDRYYQDDKHATIDPTTGLLRQDYTLVVHDEHTWLRPLITAVGLLGMLWWQDLLLPLFT